MTRIQVGPTVPERVIRAATVLFSQEGYYVTGTREIARLADISEVTLFRYFEHKEDIFLACLESGFHSVAARLNTFTRSVEGRDPQEVVPRIISLLVDVMTFSPELIKLVAVAVLELRGKYRQICGRLVAPFLNTIASYLTLNVESGKLRNLNPAILTAAMALTIIVQPEISWFINGCELSRMNGRETMEEYSSFWLKILIPSETPGVLTPPVTAERVL